MTLFSTTLTQPCNFDVSQFFSWKESGKLIIPDYQRGYVWNENQASLFMQTIFLGLPIPSVYITSRFNKTFEIVDGCQRLTTLFNFIEGKLKLNNSVKKEFQNLTFSDLSEKDKFELDHIVIPTLEFGKDTTEKEKLEMFVIINRSGTKMTDEELSIAINKLKIYETK